MIREGDHSICKCGRVIEFLDDAWFHVDTRFWDSDHYAKPVEMVVK